MIEHFKLLQYSVRACMYVGVFICMYVCMYEYIYTFIYVFTRPFKYIYACTYM